MTSFLSNFSFGLSINIDLLLGLLVLFFTVLFGGSLVRVSAYLVEYPIQSLGFNILDWHFVHLLLEGFLLHLPFDLGNTAACLCFAETSCCLQLLLSLHFSYILYWMDTEI